MVGHVISVVSCSTLKLMMVWSEVASGGVMKTLQTFSLVDRTMSNILLQKVGIHFEKTQLV